MNILQAIILGLVQGLTEFLPVSSSGHLVLFGNIFGFSTDNDLFFDTMLHLGTLVAVFIVFRKQIMDILRHPLGKMLRYLVIATIPTVIIALLFKDFFEGAFGGRLLGFSFLITSALLFLSERIKPGKKQLGNMKLFDPIAMGIIQGAAIAPGISRSGSTISMGLLRGLDKKFAAEFSFLMSIPAILGSVVMQGMKVIKSGAIHDANWMNIIAGVIVAAITGYFAIRIMLKVVQSRKLRVFAIYTFTLGILVLLDQLVFNVVMPPL